MVPISDHVFWCKTLKSRNFGDDAPGRLQESIGLHGAYLAYVPDPLPPRLDLGPVTILKLSEADRALGELKGVGRMLPNPGLLIGPFLRREAVSSSRIEGTVTDLGQLLMFETDPEENDQTADRVEVFNYVEALEFGLNRLKSLPVSQRLMREIHGRLMRGVRGEDKTPGEFRTRQNMIGRQGQQLREARFVPPPPPEMRVALDELERYIGGRVSTLPTLVDLALIHYQFETIHPFLDGNGRLGRLLISLLLCERGCLTQPLLYLSAYLENNKDAYIDHLLEVSRSGAWIGWIEFFLDGVAIQAKEAVARCNELLDLRNLYRGRLQATSNSSKLLTLVDLLFERPAMTITGAATALGVTFRAAQQNIAKLESQGILKEVTGRRSSRVFLATGIVEVIERTGAYKSP